MPDAGRATAMPMTHGHARDGTPTTHFIPKTEPCTGWNFAADKMTGHSYQNAAESVKYYAEAMSKAT